MDERASALGMIFVMVGILVLVIALAVFLIVVL